MKVKICGIKNKEDVKIINEFLPDYCGFVFAKSKRQVSNDTARQLSYDIDNRIKTVGVFVNEDVEKTAETAKQCGLYAIQLHGDEDQAYIQQLRVLCPACKIIKAVPAKDKESMENILSYGADFFLFDAYSKDERGGTGKIANWELIRSVTEGKEISFFLAGGIGPHNVAEAKTVRPFAVDLSSSVEKPEGGKSREKVAELFKNMEMIK